MEYCCENEMNFSGINSIELIWIYEALKILSILIYNEAVNYLCQQSLYYVTC